MVSPAIIEGAWANDGQDKQSEKFFHDCLLVEGWLIRIQQKNNTVDSDRQLREVNREMMQA